MGGGGHTRWGQVLVVAAVLAAGLGGAAGGLGVPAWLAGGIAAVTAVVSAAVAGWYLSARDQRKAAVEARDQVLDALTANAAEAGDATADPVGLLRADRSPMPFRGRVRQMRKLTEWRDDTTGSPVLLLSGSAGVGKSRLALEFASRVPEGWVAGWLHSGAGEAAVGTVAACGEPALILVDDADGRADIAPLLDALAERHADPAIRVILVTRSAEGLRASLAARLEERRAWVASGATALELESEGGADDRARWFSEAVRAFAAELREPVPVLSEIPPHSHAGVAEPFVMIQARALLTVLGTGDDSPDRGTTGLEALRGMAGHGLAGSHGAGAATGQADPRKLSFGEVAGTLMGHEKRRWDALARIRAWGSGGPPSEPLQERAVAALALLGAGSDAEAEQVLRRVPELRDATAERRYEIAEWITGLYPGGPGATLRIRPDVIGEWFILSQLVGNPALARSLRAELTGEQATRALGLLARAADWIEAAGPLFSEFAAGDVRRQVLAAGQAALTGDTGRHLLDALVADQLMATDEWTLGEIEEVHQLIPKHVPLRAHAAVAAQAVSLLRAMATSDPAAHLPGLALQLNHLGVQLGRLGQYKEALDAGLEAVTLYRALAADDPAAHQAALAMAQDNLGSSFDWLGRYRESVAATQDAVTLYRAIAADNPAALAGALDNLGNRLDRLGRNQEALAAAQEAVTLYRALAADDPGAHQAALSTALTNLGSRLDSLGRFRDSVAVTQEAVTLRRALAADNLAAHQDHLATALNNYGLGLFRIDQYQDGLGAAQEAVTLRRALAAEHPAAYRAALGTALNNLGSGLDLLGRHAEALDASREALAVHRALTAAAPAAHQAALAASLYNVSVQLSRLGRYAEALDAAQEAVNLRRGLAADNLAAHQPALARALGNAGTALSRLGRYAEALDAAQEAVTLYRALAADNQAAHQPDFARALGSLSVTLDQLDRHQEALDARAEAVRVYREMAGRDDDLYGATYREHLGALLREYDQHGMRHEAVTYGLGDPSPGEDGISPGHEGK